MQNVLIRTGHGYESGSRGRCEAFDGFEIIAAPLHQAGEGWQAAFGNEARASRIFNASGKPGAGCDYSSHAIKLAKMPGETVRGGGLYLLMQHGSGREVWQIPDFYGDGGTLVEHITGLPERLQYSLLMILYKMGRDAMDQGRAETRREWAQAVADKRIRRRKGRVEIVPQWEIDLKAEKTRREAGEPMPAASTVATIALA